MGCVYSDTSHSFSILPSLPGKTRRLSGEGGHSLDSGSLDVYNAAMTQLLNEAFEAVRKLPVAQQDDIGRYLLSIADETPLTPDEIAALDEAEAQIARGEFATDEEVRVFWAKHGL